VAHSFIKLTTNNYQTASKLLGYRRVAANLVYYTRLARLNPSGRVCI